MLDRFELDALKKQLIQAEQARRAAEQARREAERARQEAERETQLLHSLFQQAPTLLMVLRGPDHEVELANPVACQMFRRTEAEVLNRALFDVLPELRDQVFPKLLDGVFTTGTAYAGKETPAVFDRGGGRSETVYFNFLYTAFRNAQGEIAGVFVIATDVTAQVLAREQLNSMREAAEAANRAKDEFLAMLGHELRNPLSPILTALQLMKLQGPQGAERARDVIERQVTHLTRLVDDLLDVSRIARGKVELKREVIELAEVVAKAIEMASPLLEQRNHSLTVDVPRHGLWVNADATRLGQVVSNLLTNAAKYTPAAGRITVRARADGGEVVLSVQDTGIGIAPDVLPRIFEMFVQDSQASDRALGGLGLGLTIVRNLVERHGGSVSVRSEGPGKGSEFVVRLPRVERPELAAEGRAPATRNGRVIPSGRARVLVVDDNADGAEMLAEILTEKGYDTRVAHDAPTALRVAAEFAPNVAFLDIGLPVMDGYELASHLRDLPGLQDVRLIAVTGYGQESDRQRSREAGFHDHLVKPVDIDSLEAAVTARG